MISIPSSSNGTGRLWQFKFQRHSMDGPHGSTLVPLPRPIRVVAPWRRRDLSCCKFRTRQLQPPGPPREHSFPSNKFRKESISKPCLARFRQPTAHATRVPLAIDSSSFQLSAPASSPLPLVYKPPKPHPRSPLSPPNPPAAGELLLLHDPRFPGKPPRSPSSASSPVFFFA